MKGDARDPLPGTVLLEFGELLDADGAFQNGAGASSR